MKVGFIGLGRMGQHTFEVGENPQASTAVNVINLMSNKITVDAGFVRFGVMLQEEVDLPFPDMKLTIEVTTDASDEEMATLAKELAMFCPISKMIVAAGTELETEWIIKRP